ncbi:Cof-type HAD-IIB family hydrolase [Levilactobacillus tangyuanensis]|uniref:Cof-type HAD-IIB family hydrolase n=1 Tax=Levilactobacillus tangyuanensis TaxID=2486021 RepID=A0ABW1TPH6_9LACO|nr:HAD family hydrolase [Levilactobacillus tangyuanensis]
MAIKLIAVDLNGTLLHNDQSFNQSLFKDTLAALDKQGVRLVLSSGNQYDHLRSLFKDVMADNLAVIAENGASIYWHDQLLFDGSLSAEQLDHFLTVDRQADCLQEAYIILTGAHGSYTEKGAPKPLIEAAEKFYDNLQLVDDLTQVSDQIKKISVSVLPGAAEDTVAQLNELLAGRMRAHDSGYGVVDVVATNVGKLPAVQWLAKEWQLEANEVMAFGDGANDVPLLDYAGIGVAMQNAPADIQDVADQVTTWNNEQDGVLRTIQSQLLA